MKLVLDLDTIEGYKQFLAVKSLPIYSFTGREANFPDEYSARLGLSPQNQITSEYNPKQWLFDYQRDISRIAIRRKKFAAFLKPGLGKTVISGEYIRYLLDYLPKDKQILMVAPSMVVQQTIDEFSKFYGLDLPCERVRAKDLGNWLLNGGKYRFGITNYEAISDKITNIGKVACLILDECFPAGTLVDVFENGVLVKKAIENILPGDRIYNAHGNDKVIAVKKRKVKHAVAIKAGKRIIVSPNHPVFTQRGWVLSSDLEPGDSILSTASAVRMVQSGVYPKMSAKGNGISQQWPGEVLREVLFSEMADESAAISWPLSYAGSEGKKKIEESGMVCGRISTSGRATRENTFFEPHVEPGSQSKGIADSEGHGSRSFRAWGQWSGNDLASGDFIGCFGRQLGGGVSVVFGEENARLSESLQNRHREHREKSRYRGGWKLSLLKEGEGQEEGCETGFVRVESLEILEQGHPELERLRDARGSLNFYDIEAERHPSFSVEGLLVHNSSLLKSSYGRWGTRLIELGRGLDWKLCLTGTPAPNDRVEYANHSVFLDQFQNVNSFLAKFFINKGKTQNRWELKPHAVKPFYRSLSHWCIFLDRPGVYGWKDNAEPLPEIRTHIHDIPLTSEQWGDAIKVTNNLFGISGGIGQRSKIANIAKSVDGKKPDFIRDLANKEKTSCIIWAKYNPEQEALYERLPDAANVSGSTSEETRIEVINDFKNGKRRDLITKAKILGFGLNLQVCKRMIFSTVQDSYEDYFQCIKRANRVGSKSPLDVHIPVTEIERPMLETVLKKADRVDKDTIEQEQMFREVCYDLNR